MTLVERSGDCNRRHWLLHPPDEDGERDGDQEGAADG